MSELTIAGAAETDTPELLEMIRELAAFEQLTQELEVTQASLRDALFGPAPVAAALIARMDGASVAGYAVFYRTFSTFIGRPGIFLEDIYVRPAFRRRGIGRELLVRVAQTAVEQGGGRLEWIALRWNENALRFYQSLGASVMEGWALLRMNPEGVRQMAAAHMEK